MTELPNREVAILNAALELRPAERAGFLDQACMGDAALRQQVEALLQAHEQAENFLQAPPAGLDFKRTVRVEIPLTEKPGDKIGRYKLLQQIGEGGCGVVYMAEQEEPVRRRVALKVIKLGMDTKQVIARFEAERQALALMDHPNIAKVLDAGATETSRPYFVMELVRGIKITEFCDESKLSTEERLKLFTQVCQAIQHAHQKGVIHRDIKPSNILVTINDGLPVPKVIDFGIAKATTGRLTDQTLFTAFEQFIGTPAYMSPEQAVMTSLDIDTRSDIYSLGVLLYELLTGRTPFDAKELLAAGLDEMRRTIREDEPPRPSTRLSTMAADALTTTAKQRHTDAPKLLHLLRGDLDWIVMKCLEKDRTRRYETATGLAADVNRHLGNEPIVARPPSAGYRLQKFARRNKLAFAAASAVAIALCLGVVASTWQAVRATRQQRIADRERIRADSNAAAEATQRQTAERAVEQTRQALSKAMEIEADRLAREGSAGKALAHFARALRLDPGNRVAGQRIVSLLNQRDFPLPLSERPKTAPFDPFKVLAYSSDHRRFCVWTNHNSISVFESRDGRLVGKPFQFNPPLRWADLNHDGTRLVVGLTNSAIYWDCESGRQLAEVKGGIEARSPDERLVLTDGRVQEVDSGRELCSVTDRGRRWNAVFSSDGSKLAFLTMGSEPTDGDTLSAVVWVIATDTGEKLTEIPATFTGALPYFRFTPDNRRLIISGYTSGVVTVWDLVGKRASYQDLRNRSSVWDVDLSRDGRLLAAGSRNGETTLWNLWTGLAVGESCPGNQDVHRVRCAPDGAWLVTFTAPEGASQLQVRKWWDIRPGRALPLTMLHPANLSVIGQPAAFNHDGSLVVTVSRDGTVRVWSSESGEIQFAPVTHGGGVRRAIFGQNSQVLATGAGNGDVRLWESKSGRALKSFEPHKSAVNALALSSDGRYLASGAEDGSVNVSETASGRQVASKAGRWGTVYCLAIDPSGRRLVAGYPQDHAELLDLPSLRVIAGLSNLGSVYGVQFSHDGKWFCTASGGNGARLWNAETGEGPLVKYPHGNGVWSASFSSDDQRVVTASYDSTARVWDRASGKPLTEPLPHRNAYVKAFFSPDDRTVITSSREGTATVWDVQTGRALSDPFRHETGVQMASFSPDGKRILVAGGDGVVRIHDWVAVQDRPPVWLPELAEAVGGYRLTEAGVAEFLDDAAQRLAQLRQTLAQAADSDPLVKWGRWYLADRWARPISPYATISVRDYADKLAQQDELAALEQALDLRTQNPLAYQKLAALISAAQPEAAELYQRIATDLGGVATSPSNAAAATRNAPARSAAVGPVAEVDPLNAEDLLKREGQFVRVTGVIVNHGTSTSGSYQFLNFSKDYRAGLTLLFNRATNPEEFQSERLRAYVNKRVMVEGKLIRFQDIPEIEITTLSEIKVDGTTVASNTPPATITATAGASTNAVPVVDAGITEELLKHDGKIVRVKGRIAGFGSATSSRVYYLNFTENFRSGLSLVFFQSQNPSEFRPELLRAFVGKTVLVEGTIGIFQGRPQMVMKSLAEIRDAEEVAPPK